MRTQLCHLNCFIWTNTSVYMGDTQQIVMRLKLNIWTSIFWDRDDELKRNKTIRLVLSWVYWSDTEITGLLYNFSHEKTVPRLFVTLRMCRFPFPYIAKTKNQTSVNNIPHPGAPKEEVCLFSIRSCNHNPHPRKKPPCFDKTSGLSTSAMT